MRCNSCVAERDERGATIVEFLGVTLLVGAAVMVLLQMALWVWCRNVTVNAADGEARTRSVLRDGLGGTATGFSVRAAQDGDAVVVVATGAAPRIVPFLPSFTVHAEARALDEDTAAP